MDLDYDSICMRDFGFLDQLQKEQEQGKFNFVSLYLRENPDADIEDAVAYTKDILDKKTREFLKHALMDGFSDLPTPSRHLHLSCLKVFHMFFNSSNRYDSNTEMLHDIQKAIYIPLEVHTPSAEPLLEPLLPPLLSEPKRKEYLTMRSRSSLQASSKTNINNSRRIVKAHQVSLPAALRGEYRNMFMPPKFSLSFV